MQIRPGIAIPGAVSRASGTAAAVAELVMVGLGVGPPQAAVDIARSIAIPEARNGQCLMGLPRRYSVGSSPGDVSAEAVVTQSSSRLRLRARLGVCSSGCRTIRDE